MEPIRIGQLRYAITLYHRSDSPDPDSSGFIETLENPITTVADVQPVGPMMFYGVINADPDRPVTHKIFTRWMPLVDGVEFVIKRILNTPDGKKRVEWFRIWRLQEIEGRQRFLQFDAQLERYTYEVDADVSESADAGDTNDGEVQTLGC